MKLKALEVLKKEKKTKKKGEKEDDVAP